MTKVYPDCDKCGKPVHPGNNATLLDAIRTGNPASILLNTARHLLPTNDCVGSPSRAQYLDGQSKDSRFFYIEKNEKSIRDAYANMQRDYPAQ